MAVVRTARLHERTAPHVGPKRCALAAGHGEPPISNCKLRTKLLSQRAPLLLAFPQAPPGVDDVAGHRLHADVSPERIEGPLVKLLLRES
jgi:hypothetical protein